MAIKCAITKSLWEVWTLLLILHNFLLSKSTLPHNLKNRRLIFKIYYCKCQFFQLAMHDGCDLEEED